MSSRATGWAWSQDVAGLTKLVLLALADVANQDNKTWYSRKHLAERATVSVPTLDRAIKELVDRGMVTVEQRKREDGSLTSSLYTLLLGAITEIVPSPQQTVGTHQLIDQESNSESNNDQALLTKSTYKELVREPSLSLFYNLRGFAQSYNEASERLRGKLEAVVADAVALGLDVEVEAAKVSDWLNTRRQRKATVAFLLNWFGKNKANGTSGTTAQAVRNNGGTGTGYSQGAVQRPSPRAADAEYWKGVRAALKANGTIA